MKYLSFTLMFVFSGVVSANSYQFIGNWNNCFDPNDGGIGYARIAVEDGGIIKRGADSWHGPCGYGWPAVTYTGPLNYSSGKLVGTWYLDCQAPPTDVTGDRVLDVEYEINNNRELVESLLNNGVLVREPIICNKGRW